MLFSEEDAPLIKAWIVRRLENNSDADADVLADYVLALLRHDGSVEAIRKLFEEEIPDFLREDAAAFTHDVLQAVKYRSYLPGAPPAPPAMRQPPFPSSAALAQPRPAPRSDRMPSPTSPYDPAAPYSTHSAPQPSFSQNGSRKRAYNDREDGDVDIILTNQPLYNQPYKQPRRGGGFGQRGGRYEDQNGQRSFRGSGPFPGPHGSIPYGASLPFPPPPIDANSILENIQLLQSLLPSGIDLPSPVYSTTVNPQPHRRNKRCRNYDTKGYCSRGNSCNFEHGAQPSFNLPPMPAIVDEYDPNNAALSMPPFGVQPLPAEQQPDPSNSQSALPTNRREAKKPRRIKGRAPFASNGPNHDRSKKVIVIQNIPDENFTEDQIRAYFAQFGDIVELTIQKQNRVAMIKFESWEAANAAWSSPKVIFDNRFVKVFWHKEGSGDESMPNGKPTNNTMNGHGDSATPAGESADADSEFDLAEFYRKQVEAQKVHDEKTKKRQEIELERQKLEERERELHERQEETKRQLRAKLGANGVKDGSLPLVESSTENGEKKPSAQTEALRAQLAALEQEANQLGIDPDDNRDDTTSWPPRGRGRGRGYRGRGTFPPRASRGLHGYRGRGGAVEARHAAYAAYSLDNRPKAVTLSGIDFTKPEHDEALRQYLFSVGEFKEVHSAPEVTHVMFKDRKTAEKFMFGVSASNSIHGINGKVEPTWAKTTPELVKPTADSDVVMSSTLDDEQASKEKVNAGNGNANVEFEEGEIDNTPGHDQRDMDYEAGEW
ncbi:putative RNA recognition motif-containing protein [Rosellinia necatrix]|uniref:Putative RNA recognition motif-containing protein n=1 Tax=Rosellinia necatrix TaxID=77044 RepID=A0A1W2TAY2_ROSNE|nr:putative RNA recognition motif-containing protein [Rosellinia necatrix]